MQADQVGRRDTSAPDADTGKGHNDKLLRPNDEVAAGDKSQVFDCFLSHNNEDKPAIRALAEMLRAAGVSVWLDEERLRPGIPWQPLLEQGIEESSAGAVLVGKDGLGPWGRRP